MIIFKENRLFLRFFLARVISQIGDGIQALSILWLSYHWSNSAFIVGMVMISVSLPGILISPLAGHLADRINRVKIMVIADISRLFLVGLLAFLSFQNELNLPLLMIITALISIASAYFNPASMAILPQIVKKDYIVKANAMIQISSGFSVMLGPLIGMGLIAVVGISIAFLLNALSFLASALLISGITVEFVGQIKNESVLENLKDGFKLLKTYPVVTKMLDKTIIINFFFSSITIVIPVFANTIYHKDAKGMGMMMAGFGFGMLAASIFLSSSNFKANIKITLISFLVFMGISFIVFGVVHNFYITLLSLISIGFCLNFVNVNIISFYQNILPNEILGRIMAFLSAISLSMQPLSYGVTGMLIDWLGVGVVLVIGGVVIILSALSIRSIKELED